MEYESIEGTKYVWLRLKVGYVPDRGLWKGVTTLHDMHGTVELVRARCYRRLFEDHTV